MVFSFCSNVLHGAAGLCGAQFARGNVTPFRVDDGRGGKHGVDIATDGSEIGAAQAGAFVIFSGGQRTGARAAGEFVDAGQFFDKQRILRLKPVSSGGGCIV